MEYTDKEYCIELRGDFACFTRPEMKVERVSYDIITPSAARNIFQAIFWKPAICWEITRIEVLNPIKRFSVRRNEVASGMSPKSPHLLIEEHRTQKTAYILRDVAYRIFGKLVFIPIRERSIEEQAKVTDPKNENPMKYQQVFERRAEQGQCFTQPYLGCREFSCSFELIKDATYGQGIPESRSLGYMLYDLDFARNPRSPQPMFFEAIMENGVVSIPEPNSDKILR
ncbi:CRISPR-associated protein [Porphyromonas gulae]|uniref:type I-C CRISPR-associated protein Cas5c n=1 Tax=Porphyromonas gulae TaxID=111105 RepID=UPI00052C6A9E|nr:type I-C CRISPR-associated protein Cas5c [Porphyromonas gulae]KGN67233.1 CRISPR-associated protein [Porphyromonas gulae]KGO03060.1 CRISPR-associated protein [Porphyromonas gulae]